MDYIPRIGPPPPPPRCESYPPARTRDRCNNARGGRTWRASGAQIVEGGMARCGKRPKDRSLTERPIVGQRGLEWVCVWSLNTVAHVPAGPFSRALAHTHTTYTSTHAHGRSNACLAHAHARGSIIYIYTAHNNVRRRGLSRVYLSYVYTPRERAL